MYPISKLFARIGLALLVGICAASAHAAVVAGRDYVPVSPAQQTDAKGKVEVIEFFSYACPHCHAFEPTLEPWIKKLPKDVEFKRIPVIFRDTWGPLAKLYFALEAIGELERLHAAAFDAMHLDNINLSDPSIQADWVAKKGVDRKKFVDAYNSFSVQSKVNRAQQIAQGYKVSGVPAIAVAGRFMTSQSMAGGSEGTLRVVEELVEQVRREIATSKK